MQFRQHIASAVVVLCAANVVSGREVTSSQQTTNSVATGKDVTSPFGLNAAQDSASTTFTDRQAEVIVAAYDESTTGRSEDKDEHWISSSESVPAPSIDNINSGSSPATLVARQEEAEPSATPDPDALPIEPKITPAIGIAGAIMLGTGVALTLIGIKKQWLHIFLSTAYLASLAVTVLIIYVMNPEHSNAIQGAYMVAAVVTGLIFGAVSLVFQEVAEGLGCMLGSFCFAMWLLVLAPGGIIHSTAGRGILIGVITVVGFALSFSHYTRMYGLLVCTSFAGATITILGVDCFSRAGLKEFWLYLWQLNDKQFPLETNTYPITRGIRVEIACVIVVFLLGLVSQFKLWKVVKTRREKNEEARRLAEQERADAEAAVGRDIEANNERERAQWEAVYGEKHASRVHTDSAIGSSVETFGKDHVSVREREVDAVELSDIAEVQSPPHSSDEFHHAAENRRKSGEVANIDMTEDEKRSRRSSQTSTPTTNDQGTSIGGEANATDEKTYAPGAPEVVPLPFHIPTDEEEQNNNVDRKSEASKAIVEDAPSESVAMPLKKQSLMQLNEQFAAGHLRPRDDQESSIAATADDVAVLDDESPAQGSRRSSLAEPRPGNGNLSVPANEDTQSRRTSVVSDREMEQALDEEDDEALPRDPVVIPPPVAPAVPATTEPSRQVSTSTRGGRRLSGATNAQKPDGSSDGRPGSVSEGMVEQLPPKLSKIALTYRTNEWAKHIADADHPENPEDLERPSSPGVQVDTNFPEEVARPVDVEALQQTNAPVEPPMPTHTSSKASRKSHRKSRQSEPINNLNRTSSTQSVTPLYAFSRSGSQQSLHRHESTSSSPVRPNLGSMRKSSMPLTSQPLVESPVEDAASTFQPMNSPQTNADFYPNTSANTSASNLLDERTKMLQRRPTTTSFNGFRSTPSLGLMSGAIPENSTPEPTTGFATPSETSPNLAHQSFDPNTPTAADDENMTLSQRRSLMQLNGTAPGIAATPTHKPRPSIFSTNTFESHQPARQPSTSTAQQSARLNQWRQTLQADAQSKQPPLVVERDARQSMIAGRRESEMRNAKKKEVEGRRQSAIDEAMRRGQLDGAHRDAMRKMQAKANK